MAAKSGHEAVVEQLLADGFGYIFGNPGTSEEGLLDAIERRSRAEVRPGAPGIGRGPGGRWLCPRHESADRRADPQYSGPGQRDRRPVSGPPRALAPGRHRRRRRYPLPGHGRPDGRRPRCHGQTRDQVVDDGPGPSLGAASSPPGHQDRGHSADAARSTFACRWTCWTFPPRRKSTPPRSPRRASFPTSRLLLGSPRCSPRPTSR